MRFGIGRLYGRGRDKPTVKDVHDAQKRIRGLIEREPVLTRQAYVRWDEVVGGVLVPETWPNIPSIKMPDGRVNYCPRCGPSFDIKPRWQWETLPGVLGNGYVWSCALCCTRNMEQTWPSECDCCRLPRFVSWQLGLGNPVPPRE